MFQYPHPCLGSLTAVKPAPFWCHIWPNSWVAKEMDELGRLTECGVQSSAASFACLPASETSGFAWHEEALGSIFKCCHFQHSSWLHGERGDGPGWKPGRQRKIKSLRLHEEIWKGRFQYFKQIAQFHLGCSGNWKKMSPNPKPSGWFHRLNSHGNC